MRRVSNGREEKDSICRRRNVSHDKEWKHSGLLQGTGCCPVWWKSGCGIQSTKDKARERGREQITEILGEYHIGLTICN